MFVLKSSGDSWTVFNSPSIANSFSILWRICMTVLATSYCFVILFAWVKARKFYVSNVQSHARFWWGAISRKSPLVSANSAKIPLGLGEFSRNSPPLGVISYKNFHKRGRGDSEGLFVYSSRSLSLSLIVWKWMYKEWLKFQTKWNIIIQMDTIVYEGSYF